MIIPVRDLGQITRFCFIIFLVAGQRIDLAILYVLMLILLKK